MKLDKAVVQRRLDLMAAEGVVRYFKVHNLHMADLLIPPLGFILRG